MAKVVTVNNRKVWLHEFKDRKVYAFRATDTSANSIYLSLCNSYNKVNFTTIIGQGNNINYYEIECR